MSEVQSYGPAWAKTDRPIARERPPQAEVMSVIAVRFNRGSGVDPDPIREVIRYYAFDGTLLAERDMWKDENGPSDG